MFGEKLKSLRKDKNLTQEELGKIFGVAKNTVSYWESNENKPDIDLIKEIAKYFNVTTDYLLGLDKEDHDKIEILKNALKDAGINDIDTAMQIVSVLRDKKDTDK